MKKEKNLIKTELATIYLTTNDKKFLDINDAIEHQGIIEKHKEKKMEEIQMIVDVKNLIKEVLEKNDWGIYFRTWSKTKFKTKRLLFKKRRSRKIK